MNFEEKKTFVSQIAYDELGLPCNCLRRACSGFEKLFSPHSVFCKNFDCNRSWQNYCCYLIMNGDYVNVGIYVFNPPVWTSDCFKENSISLDVSWVERTCKVIHTPSYFGGLWEVEFEDKILALAEVGRLVKRGSIWKEKFEGSKLCGE